MIDYFSICFISGQSVSQSLHLHMYADFYNTYAKAEQPVRLILHRFLF